jgi:hypothetical protein
VKQKVVDQGKSFSKPLSLPQLEFGIKSYGQDTLTALFSLTAFSTLF